MRTRVRDSPLLRPLVAVATLLLAILTLLLEPVLAITFLVVPTVVLLAERCRRDAVVVLTLFIACSVVIPANLVVEPLGSAGRPAMLVGLAAAWWWFHARILPDSGAAHGSQPIRWMALLFSAAVVASYAAAFTRAIDGQEAGAANRGILLVVALGGVLLLAADGITTRERLDTLLRRLVAAGAALAVIGIVQFLGHDLSGALRVPFLTDHSSFEAFIQLRGNQRRVPGTTSHPIEFGVVLAFIFPLALHYLLYAKRSRSLMWAAVVLISLAIPMSVSRSGTLAVGITFLAMWFTWPNRLRVASAVGGVIFLGAMRSAVPGLLGTIRSLFTNLSQDDSVKGRTNDYSVVGDFISERPIFGRGFGTFLPDRYIFLDNQYLALMIDTGIVGTVIFVTLLLVGIGSARGARRGADAETRSLGQALAGAILAGMLSAGTFDLLGFSVAAGVLFLLMGSAGALWRLTADTRAEATAASRAHRTDADWLPVMSGG